jgi:hypothetical protein
MNKTSGLFDLMKDNTSDLLNFNRFNSEFAFQQQIDRILLHSTADASALDGWIASSSRARF